MVSATELVTRCVYKSSEIPDKDDPSGIQLLQESWNNDILENKLTRIVRSDKTCKPVSPVIR